ncbi:hypothetical protein F5Y12DRAFT_716496 [Xylaria sp. FL1777]|nr:hypothetical protein F5Y12DRAFT_716496 [Xylaria sp. FL1777]
MKVAATTALLAIGVTAQPHIEGRDATIVTGLLASIFDSMANADNHVLQYQGGDPVALRQAGGELISVIGQGIETAKIMAPLTPLDVIAICPLSKELSGIGGRFLQNLGEAAPKFAASGHCAHVHMFATHLAGVSSEFFATIKEKYPAESQGYANEEIEETDARFTALLAALSPPFCVDPVEAAPGEGEGGCHGEPAGKPSITTSISWHTGSGFPGLPTAPPGGHHPSGPANGTYPGKPIIPPVTGSGAVLAISSAAMALVMGVASFVL